MDWLMPLVIIIGGFLVLMFMGMPIAFAFIMINVGGALLIWGGVPGMMQLILSIYESVTSFTIMPIIYFSLLGEVMFISGIAPRMIDAISKTLGRLPGRLSLVTVAGAALLSTMSGASIGTTALLGDVFLPEMEKRGYKKPMTLGPILGSGGLAMMIPPTGLGILLAALAQVSVGRFLIAIFIPGILLAVFYGAYVIIRCILQPDLTPTLDTVGLSIVEKIKLNFKYVLPMGLIIFLVLGLIFLGIATPSQSAAMGVIGAVFLAAVYKGLSLAMLKKAVKSTVLISGMVLIIMSAASAFSQLLAFTGASRGLIAAALQLSVDPLFIIVIMLIVALIMGTFMNPVSIMMITIPIYMPIVNRLGFDGIWFSAMLLLVMEMGQSTPPFGILLFVMKGVAPPGTSMMDIYKAGLPFLGCDLALLALMLFLPPIVLWLPAFMN